MIIRVTYGKNIYPSKQASGLPLLWSEHVPPKFILEPDPLCGRLKWWVPLGVALVMKTLPSWIGSMPFSQPLRASCQVKKQGGCASWNLGEWAFTRHSICGRLDIELPTLRPMRNKFPLLVTQVFGCSTASGLRQASAYPLNLGGICSKLCGQCPRAISEVIKPANFLP